MIRRALLTLLLLALAVPAGASEQDGRELRFTATTGTWMHPDVSPDGRVVLFDLLGDIYAVDAAGGSARPVLTGAPFETQPVFSPDGRRFAFVSDRSGFANLWVADADGSNPRQISSETSLNVMAAPEWSPDGATVYVSRMVHSVLAFEVWSFPAEGGAGTQVTKAQPNGDDDWDNRRNILGAQVSPDGAAIYYAVRSGHLWTIADPPVWSVARRELATGAEQTVVEGSGGAMSPALSHDGRRLAYAARDGERTLLRLRDLETGADRALTEIDHDGQEGGFYAGLTPRFSFTPDDAGILLSRDGKIARLNLADLAVADIPFTAEVDLALGPNPRLSFAEETGPVRVRVIQAPRLSPDGRTIAFTALGGLYLQDRAGGTPRRVSEAGDTAFQPAWSPDGATLAYVSWTAHDGGAVWTAPAAGGAPTRLTTTGAYYTEPVFSPDGATLAVLRASQYDRVRAANEISPLRMTDVVRLPAGGGEETRLARLFGARLLDFDRAGKRLRVYTPGGLASIPLAGGEPRIELGVIGQSPSQYVGVHVPVDEARLSPDGAHALVRHASELWLVDVPARQGDAPPVVDLGTDGAPAHRITAVGADFAGWTGQGDLIWSVGSTLRLLPLAEVDRTSTTAVEVAAERITAVVELPRDVPPGAVVLRGATALTMRGDEVIENADVLVVGGRIAAIGRRGQVVLPEGAEIRRLDGKFLTPGFIDAHAHWFEIRRGLHQAGHWDFLINLAFGVTSGLEVQPFTADIFAYQDMIDAGRMPGPRAWSTGPGMFRNSPHATEEDIAGVLGRYRDHYRTRNIKAYMVGDRAERQRVAGVLADMGMMATTEGASDLNLGLTHFIDGFAGNEHALPVTPLREDVVRLMAASRTSYTPTLSVLYGGWPALFERIIHDRPQDDPRIRRFMPPEIVAEKLRDRHWAPEEAQTYARFARDALSVQRAGGLVGMGSHGEVQGLGMHWEMQAYAAGGATPMEVLHAATMGSAETIGRSGEVGSLEPGKFADILILDADPREAIANTLSLRQVMKNGRIYDASTLDEVWPVARPLNPDWLPPVEPQANSAP